MGTFHQNLGELHGMTVVIETIGPTVYIGRCHEANEQKVILHDVDQHTDGDKGLSNADYLHQATQWGVFKKHDHLIIPRDQVARITRLGDLAGDI